MFADIGISLKSLLAKFRRNCAGTIAPIFALAMLPIMTAVGAAIDYSSANKVRSSMQVALDTDEAMLITLGRLLFNALFQGDIRAAYTNAQSALSADQGLRLSFEIDPGQADIAQLPWEFLCDATDRPLVMLNTSIVRYLRMLKRPPVK
jgi:hypothetical protein